MQGQFPSNRIRDAFCKKNAGVYLYIWYFQLWNPPLQSCFLALIFSRVPFLLFIISNRLSTVFMGAVMNGKLECSELTIVLLSFFRSDKWCFAFSISSLPQEPDRMCACVFVSVWFWAECYFSFINCVLLCCLKKKPVFSDHLTSASRWHYGFGPLFAFFWGGELVLSARLPLLCVMFTQLCL